MLILFFLSTVLFQRCSVSRSRSIVSTSGFVSILRSVVSSIGALGVAGEEGGDLDTRFSQARSVNCRTGSLISVKVFQKYESRFLCQFFRFRIPFQI